MEGLFFQALIYGCIGTLQVGLLAKPDNARMY